MVPGIPFMARLGRQPRLIACEVGAQFIAPVVQFIA